LHRSIPRVRGTVIGIAIAIAAAACAAGSQAGAEGDATIAFASPANGAAVSIPFDVQLEASVPLGEPETGNYHAHLYFDSPTSAADYDIVYGTSWQVTRPLAPGEHTIIVALANPDHSLAGPEQTITLTVEAGASGGGPSQSSESPVLPGY
jgi:hypothetical protein